MSELDRSEADLLLEAAGEEAARSARQRALARLESLRDEALDVLEHSLRDEADRPLRVAAAREVLDLIGVRVEPAASAAVPIEADDERTEPGLRAVRRAQLRMRLGAAGLVMFVAALALLSTLALDRALGPQQEPRAKRSQPAKVLEAVRVSATLAAPTLKQVLEPAPAPAAPLLPVPTPRAKSAAFEPAGLSAPAHVKREFEARPVAIAIQKRATPLEVRPPAGAELASSSQPGRGRAIVGRLGIRMDEADF